MTHPLDSIRGVGNNSYTCEGGVEADISCASVPANSTYLLEKYKQ